MLGVLYIGVKKGRVPKKKNVFPSWGGYPTLPLLWRAVVWPRLTQGCEHGFNFPAAAWIQYHSDVAVAAVPPELDEPPPSKKGHVKTKNLLSGDLTVSLAPSSLPTPSHSLKPFLKANEAAPNAPGDCPNSPLEMPLESGLPHPENPLCAGGMSQPALLHFSSSWPLGNDTQPLTRSPGAISEANTVAEQFPLYTVTQFYTHTAKRQGRDPAVTHTSVSATKTSAVPQPRVCFGAQFTSAHPRATFYGPCLPHSCWTAKHCYLIFVTVFALVMLNKPEGSTTANTKIDSVYKRIKRTNSCWESLSVYRKQAPLHDSSFSDWWKFVNQKEWQKTCHYIPLKQTSAVLRLANSILHKPLISKRFIKTKDLCLVPTCLHWGWTLLSPLKHSWSLDLVTESCYFWHWFHVKEPLQLELSPCEPVTLQSWVKRRCLSCYLPLTRSRSPEDDSHFRSTAFSLFDRLHFKMLHKSKNSHKYFGSPVSC